MTTFRFGNYFNTTKHVGDETLTIFYRNPSGSDILDIKPAVFLKIYSSCNPTNIPSDYCQAISTTNVVALLCCNRYNQVYMSCNHKCV